MSQEISLPRPQEMGRMSLEEAIARRRSIRDFTSEPITLAELSQILQAGGGISGTKRRRRTVPSAGATYPLKIFVVCGQNCVEGLEAGIYHYNVDTHTLTLHQKGDARLELSRAALSQSFIYEAPVDTVICAEYERTARRYGKGAERYVHFEVGHAGQNIYLQATALNLGTVAVGAFSDERVSEVLHLGKLLKPLYIMPIGKPVPA
jgi:SagB-type dehydrogenase family enzyme